MTKQQKEEKASRLKTRLELYYRREMEMLDKGVQSYGIGTHNLTRYQTDLAEIRKAIKEMEEQIEELEGGTKRKAVGVIPRDW
jgi:cell division protein FtsB